MIFGSGKSTAWNCRVAAAGICWDLDCLARQAWFSCWKNLFWDIEGATATWADVFLRCLLLRLPGKEWFFGGKIIFTEIGEWRSLGSASWRGAGKNEFLGRENHFFSNWRLAIVAGQGLGFLLGIRLLRYALLLSRLSGKKKFWVGKITETWRGATADTQRDRHTHTHRQRDTCRETRRKSRTRRGTPTQEKGEQAGDWAQDLQFTRLTPCHWAKDGLP